MFSQGLDNTFLASENRVAPLDGHEREEHPLGEKPPQPPAAPSEEKPEGPPPLDLSPSEDREGTSQNTEPPREEARPPAHAEPEAPLEPAEPGKVLNGGFEKGLQGWRVGPREGENVRTDSAAAKSGKQSLRLWSARSGINPWATQEVQLFGKASRATVVAYARPTLAQLARLVVRLELLDGAGMSLKRYYLQELLTNAKEWQELRGELPLPPQAERLRITLRLVGTGGVWIDDVATSVQPADLLLMPRRVASTEGKPAVVRVDLVAPPDGELAAFLGKQANALPVSRQDQEIAVELPPLKPGHVTLELRSGEATDAVEVWTTLVERRPKMLTEHGWWDIGGRPVALSVIFHAYPSELPAIAEQGFSAAQVMAPLNREAAVKFLRSIPKDTLPLLLPAPFSIPDSERDKAVKNFLDVLSETGRDRRVVGWIIADEPELRLNSDAPDLYLRAKKANGLHPMLVVLAELEEIAFWSQFADGVLLNLCALGANIPEIYELVRQVATHLEPWQPVGAILPAGWSSDQPSPDPNRLRLAAFAAVAGGAKMLGWYCLHSTGWDLQATPLWPQFRSIHEDLAKLTNVIADWPKADAMKVEGEGLITASWSKDTRRVILLVNADSSEHVATVLGDEPIAEARSILGELTPTVESGMLKIAVPPTSAVAFTIAMGPQPETSQPQEDSTTKGNDMTTGSKSTQPAPQGSSQPPL